MVIRLQKFGSIRSSSFRAEGCEAPLERRGSLVEAPVGAAEGHFGPNRSSDQPGGRPAVRCSSKFRNWHNSDLPRCPRSGRQSGGKRTSRARERTAVPPRHRGRARERAEDPTIIPAPPPLCWAGGGPDAAAIAASVTRPFQEMRSKRN